MNLFSRSKKPGSRQLIVAIPCQLKGCSVWRVVTWDEETNATVPLKAILQFM